MNRALRRELTKKKWISRAKKVYNSCGMFYVPIEGIKAYVQYNCPLSRNKAMKRCESISEFLDNSIYAKLLKNCTTPYRTKMEQLEHKYENRKSRHANKSIIESELNEYVTGKIDLS